jgi:hypothetical protein
MGLVFIFATISMIFFASLGRSTHQSRTMTTRDRISIGVRNAAGMMASLRNSVRASNGSAPINLELNYCLGGIMLNMCKNDFEYPLTLFSPVIAMDAAGNPLGLLPITAAKGSLSSVRFDSFGLPCNKTSPDCIFVVYTSFRAQCPPAKLPLAPLLPTDPAYMNYFKPMATCTIAEAITVTYNIEVAPEIKTSSDNGLLDFAPITGTMTTSVKDIFGNDPR